MKRPLRSVLILSAALAAALVARPARADHDDDEDCRGSYRAAPPPYEPAPPPAAWQPAPPAPPVVYEPARPVYWRGGWAFRELRREYWRLEAARDRFYATWEGSPWRRDRFEAWYAARRAELDHRGQELAAWRGHGRGW